ncbi:MAG: electron transport complex subunit RsxE [Firmicutes bacterium]|nr:electron transport complex subunit RsxE [Bacillota bacterium]
MDKKHFKQTLLGGFVSNPVFVLVLGLCPTIAKSTNIVDAFALGAATAFVLICTNVLVSLLKKAIPDKIRLISYIIIIAGFTTLVDIFIRAYLPALNQTVGSVIPLIAVNCLILGRADSFARKNKVGYAALDGASMGIGFMIGITLLGAARQLLGMAGLSVFTTAAGGLLLLGLLLGLYNYIRSLIYTARKKRTRTLRRIKPNPFKGGKSQ